MEIVMKKTVLQKVGELLMEKIVRDGVASVFAVDYIRLSKEDMTQLKSEVPPCIFDKKDEVFFYVNLTEEFNPVLQHFPVTCKAVA